MADTTQEKVDAWEVAMPLLTAMFEQFQDLSKKKPEGAVSKPKIAVVNRLLRKCREILAAEATLEFLDLLDEGQVPQNSDVVLVLSQYDSAMKHFRNAHTDSLDYDGEVWSIERPETDDEDDENDEDENEN